MKIKEFIENFTNVSKAIIERVETYKDLSGEEKKERVDEVVTNYVTGVIDNIQVNFIVRFILKKLLIDNIPTITQIIFDLIKTKISGITKWGLLL